MLGDLVSDKVIIVWQGVWSTSKKAATGNLKLLSYILLGLLSSWLTLKYSVMKSIGKKIETNLILTSLCVAAQWQKMKKVLLVDPKQFVKIKKWESTQKQAGAELGQA